MSTSTTGNGQAFDLERAKREHDGWAGHEWRGHVKVIAGPTTTRNEYMVMDGDSCLMAEAQYLSNLPASPPSREPVGRVAVYFSGPAMEALEEGEGIEVVAFPEGHVEFEAPIRASARYRHVLPLTPDGEGGGKAEAYRRGVEDMRREAQAIARGESNCGGTPSSTEARIQHLYIQTPRDLTSTDGEGEPRGTTISEFIESRKRLERENPEVLKAGVQALRNAAEAFGDDDDDEPDGEGEGDEGPTANELIDDFYKSIQQAWPGKKLAVSEHPFELITKLIDERDEKQGLAESLARENDAFAQRLKAHPEPLRVREVLEEADRVLGECRDAIECGARHDPHCCTTDDPNKTRNKIVELLKSIPADAADAAGRGECERCKRYDAEVDRWLEGFRSENSAENINMLAGECLRTREQRDAARQEAEQAHREAEAMNGACNRWESEAERLREQKEQLRELAESEIRQTLPGTQRRQFALRVRQHLDTTPSQPGPVEWAEDDLWERKRWVIQPPQNTAQFEGELGVWDDRKSIYVSRGHRNWDEALAAAREHPQQQEPDDAR